MSHGDTIPLQSSSQSDIDEIESLINLSAVAAAVPPATRPTDVPASIPVSVSSSAYSVPPVVVPEASAPPPPLPSTAKISSSGGGGGSGSGGSKGGGMAPAGFGGGPNYNTLTEPVWETVKRDVARVGRNVRTVVFPNPFREDPGRALRDWDLWGPFVFILVLGVAVSYAASADKSKVFAVVYAVLAVGAVVLTLNVLLLGGHIIFFQSLSLLGYCLFPLDIGAVICMFQGHAIVKAVIVAVTLAWSSWAAYPFMSAAVPPNRKALAIYPVFLLYISIAFFIFAV